MAHLPGIDSSPLGLSEALSATAERLRGSVVQVRAGRGGIGSGVIWQRQPEGGDADRFLIVTNEHVVRAAGSGGLAVLAPDGRDLPAVVVDHDPDHDLALLSVHGAGLRPAEVGDSAALRVGELVLAMGNPFGKLDTLTMGIVAARAPADPDLPLEPAEPGEEPARAAPAQRTRDEGDSPRQRAGRTPDLIQADVRLYPGNSGGPLTDARGRVVGINSMVGGGLAFAIPSRIVQQFIAQSAAGGGVRPRLGVQILDVDVPATLRARAGVAAETAVLVGGVEDGSPAAAAGVLTGDLIVGLNGHAIRSVRELLYAVRISAPEGPWSLRLVRGGERRELVVRLPERVAAA